jgi:hypothetical protein
MWKPGTSKPKSEALPQKGSKKEDSGDVIAENGQGRLPCAISGSKKKLSGATMGMRFMARKMEAEEARKKTLKEKEEREQMEWTAEQDSGPVEECDEEAQVPQEATPSDMYGLRSDLIGRRSFGGVQPKVNDTWKSSWNEWEKKGNASEKSVHISDDELLRRYKNGNVDSTAAAAPIGNLQDKVKKGKRKNQSPHRGEKRKR